MSTMGKIVDRAAELAGRIKRSGSTLHASAVDLAADHATVTAEKQQLLAAGEPVEAQRVTLDQAIASCAAAKLATLAPALCASLTPSLLLEGDGTVTGLSRPIPLANAVGPVDLGLLCLIAPGLVREGLGQALPNVEGAPFPPMAQRPALLAALDQKLAAIEAEHAALVDQAATVGVGIAHLEITAARRAVAAHQAELQQEQRERANRANGRSSRLSGR